MSLTADPSRRSIDLMAIKVLGPVQVDSSSGSPDGTSLAPRDRVVLSVLAMRRGQVVPAEVIADALWGGAVPPTWTKVVQGCIVRLRRLLGPEVIETREHGYRLAVSSQELDSQRFEQMVGRAHELLLLGEPDRAAYTVDEALQLWRGEPLTELEEWEPARSETQRLRELRLDAEELLLEASLAAGRFREVLPAARAGVTEGPLREARWGLLARAQYQAGRQADALRTLRQAAQVLRNELGLDPGPDLVALEQAILRQDPELVAEYLPQSSARCPYLGLVPYDLDDTDAFFGRETEVADCLERLGRTGLLAVVGPSGSGKSSLVRAGLAASLRRDGLHVVVITPGPHPLDALTAVRGVGPSPILVVDQCEEVTTLCEDPDEREQFFAAVAAHAERAPVIVALRADRLGELSAHPAFASLVEGGLYLLKQMSEAQLRQVVESPARQAGLLLEPGLVDLLVREVEGEPGSLPLLSHALRQTWVRREGNTLTVAGYHASGEIRGAVAQTAEEVYARAPEQQQRALRDLLLRMVVPSPEGDPVRARVARQAVVTSTQHEALVETLVGARLVTSDDGVIELAHEALVRAWPRLQGWLADDVEGQRVWRHLATSTEAWEAMGRPDSELYRGTRLVRALDWRDQEGHDLTDSENAFLDASREAARTETDRAREEAVRQRRINRRLRTLVSTVAALALVAAAFGGAALIQAGNARDQAVRADDEASRAEGQAARADAEAQTARSHELAAAAVSTLSEDPSLARLLAVAAAQASPASLQTTTALHRTRSEDISISRLSLLQDVGRLRGELHPDGDRVVLAGEWPEGGSSRSLEVQDAETGEFLWSYRIPDEPGHESAFVSRALYSQDGSLLLAGVIWEPSSPQRLGAEVAADARPPADLAGVHVWDALTHDHLRVIDLGPCGGRPESATATHVLVHTSPLPQGGVPEDCDWRIDEGAVDLVDLASGEVTRLTTEAPDYWGVGALSANGERVAWVENHQLGGGTRQVSEAVVVDLATEEEVLRTEIPVDWLQDISPDGSRILVSGDPPRVIDVTTGDTLGQWFGSELSNVYGRFTPDGGAVYSTAGDRALHVWDAETGAEVFTLPAVGEGAISVSPQFRVLVSRHGDGTAVLLDDSGPRGELLTVLTTCWQEGAFYGSDQLRVVDGQIVLAEICLERGDRHIGARVVDPGTGDYRDVGIAFTAQAFDVSPDGRHLVVNGATPAKDEQQGPVVVDLATGEEAVRLQGLCTGWTNAAGPQAAGCATFPRTPFPFVAWRARWSPDGSLLGAVGEGGDGRANGLAVWDAATGEVVFAGQGEDSPEHSERGHPTDLIFTPDSTGLVVSYSGGVVARLTTTTWTEEAVVRPDIEGAHALGLPAYTSDGGSLVVVGPYRLNEEGGSDVHVLDAETLLPLRSTVNAHEGSMRAAALSPDGTRLATAAAEGRVRIWDVASLAMLDEIPFPQRVQGLGWTSDRHLATAMQNGPLQIFTTDPPELLDLVASSLTRGLTSAECSRFGFDPCPSLAELRGDEPSEDSREVEGSYAVSWTAEDLVELMRAAHEEALGDPLDASSLETLEVLASAAGGDYVLSLAGGRYEVTRTDQEEPFCAGSYRAENGRLRLTAEQGTGCHRYHYLDAAYSLDEDGLTLSAADFRGATTERYLWTSVPLSRTG